MKIKILIFLNIFALNCYGMTLEKAIEEDNVRAVREFLNNGIAVDSDITGLTLLGKAVLYDAFDVAELLIMHGADVKLKKYLMSPLNWAITTKNKRIAKLLLDNGSDPNDDHSLFYAVGKNNFEMVDLLLENRANISQKNESNQTIFEASEYNSASKAIKALLKEKRKEEEEEQLIEEAKKTAEGKPEEKKS